MYVMCLTFFPLSFNSFVLFLYSAPNGSDCAFPAPGFIGLWAPAADIIGAMFCAGIPPTAGIPIGTIPRI